MEEPASFTHRVTIEEGLSCEGCSQDHCPDCFDEGYPMPTPESPSQRAARIKEISRHPRLNAEQIDKMVGQQILECEIETTDQKIKSLADFLVKN